MSKLEFNEKQLAFIERAGRIYSAAFDEAARWLATEYPPERRAATLRERANREALRALGIDYPHTRGTLTPTMRASVYARDGRRCRHCGGESGPFHIDHMRPVSRGGTNDLENLQILCAPCNYKKSDR